jgi:hypothetical protein
LTGFSYLPIKLVDFGEVVLLLLLLLEVVVEVEPDLGINSGIFTMSVVEAGLNTGDCTRSLDLLLL